MVDLIQDYRLMEDEAEEGVDRAQQLENPLEILQDKMIVHWLSIDRLLLKE